MVEEAVSRGRHLAKAITWRILGTVDTILISWFFTGSLAVGAAIGGFEVITKTILYYVHERVWYKHIKFGLKNKGVK
jgi:uncharacterized membrane protein